MTTDTDANGKTEHESASQAHGDSAASSTSTRPARASSAPQASDATPSDPPRAASELPPDPLESLRAELAALGAERDKLREQLLRTAADFENFRKRAKRDTEDARSRGRDDLVRDLLPVFDNLERAVTSSTPTSDVKSVVDGIRMVLKLFEDSSERLGLVRVKTTGERFDPAVHEAIQQLETAEHAPGTIVREVVAGYRFGERLVRPAMVVVARKPADAPAPAADPPAAADAPTGDPAAASPRPPAQAGEEPRGSSPPADDTSSPSSDGES